MVKETFVTEGVIESKHRGIYEIIEKYMNTGVSRSGQRIDGVRGGNGLKIEDEE